MHEGCKMSPAISKNQKVLIDFNPDHNPDGLSSGNNCYFQANDGSHSAEDVSVLFIFLKL